MTGEFKGEGAELEAREWYAVELGTNYENIEIVKTELITPKQKTLKEAMAHLPAIDFDKTPQPIINGKKLFPQMEKNQGGRITGELCIKIWESETEEEDEDGDTKTVDCYMYDIFDNKEGEGDSIDGGCCTGSINDALEMAVSQAL